HSGKDVTEEKALAEAKLRRGDPSRLVRNETLKRQVLPALLDRIRALGSARSRAVVDAALTEMHSHFQEEILRLRELAEVNDHVHPGEITALESQERELASAISSARIRIDAVRLIWKAPPQENR